MGAEKTPHNFLLHLRNHRPALARRLDGVRTLGFSAPDGRLSIRIDTTTWPGRDVLDRLEEFTAEARAFFGPAAAVEVETAPPDPERLPFPVTATKYWNHVVFFGWDEGGGLDACVIAKPAYATLLSMPEGEGEPGVQIRLEGGGNPKGDGLDRALDALPPLVDRVCAIAREALSYAQFVTAFPGDAAADRLEARFFAVKEWGTPETPSPILQRFVGRIHYVDPDRPLRGLRALRGRG